MALVRRRVINPTPAVLALVNPKKKRGKKMAHKKKTQRRVHNPKPVKAAKRRALRTHHNPIHRRRRVYATRRRHNPERGAGSEVFNYTVAGISLGLVTPPIARIASGVLPFGAYNAPIISMGSGWLLSKLFEVFGPTRRFAHPTFVFGVSAGLMQIVQPIVAKTISGVSPSAAPTGMGARYRRGGMQGIGVVTGTPPQIVPPPPPPPPPPPHTNNNSLQGLAMRPGNYGY